MRLLESDVPDCFKLNTSIKCCIFMSFKFTCSDVVNLPWGLLNCGSEVNVIGWDEVRDHAVVSTFEEKCLEQYIHEMQVTQDCSAV